MSAGTSPVDFHGIYRKYTGIQRRKEKCLQPVALSDTLQVSNDGVRKHFRINLRGLDGGMPQHLLHRRDGDALMHQQRRLDAALPKSKLDGLQVDNKLEEQRIEFGGLRVVDDLRTILVPVLRLEVDVSRQVDVTLIELGFYLHKGGALVVELVFAVVHQSISYFLHSFFVRKGRKW